MCRAKLLKIGPLEAFSAPYSFKIFNATKSMSTSNSSIIILSTIVPASFPFNFSKNCV